ncbi:CehA/McbA family metallohydrolase [Solimonas marina]|uniref:CehA/McbA family metallohydrolase n=1 Tax=Solimonas marina TaxID=2714601 RepID=A0A969WAA5_9GAMM|nr:CehA/McbA family metallohydrolase [Solimonas marina]NKF22390.1 CehA/McbA family metallohydrolase [Solimonas marina]
MRGFWSATLCAFALMGCGGGSGGASDGGSQHRLTVVVDGDGDGDVVSTPAGIDCGTQCAATFDAGNTITLTASAAAGGRFAGFDGACSGDTCTLTLDRDQTVNAHFTAATASACDSDDAPGGPLLPYRGLIHAHTAYSDGDIHSTPHDVFVAGHDNGLDFVAVTDHSDTLNDILYLSVGSDCFESLTGLLTCLVPDVGDFHKWEATRQQQDADRVNGYVPIRGFEWTSDRFGHINVLFSSNFTNAKLDGGYVGSMTPFWDWLQRAPGPDLTAGVTALGGGADGLGIFNHPGDKCLSDNDASCNWNDFEYVAGTDAQMIGIEVFNSGTSGDRPEAGRKDRYADHYMRALDQGWHVGAIGGEDMHDTTWALPSHPKTVVLAESLDEAGLYAAMKARRTYALVGRLAGEDLTIDLDAGGYPMGARLQCDSGAGVALRVSVSRADGTPFDGILQLYDHADPDAPLADGPGSPLFTARGDTLRYTLPVGADGEHWFFVRVDNAAGESLAYSSPIWIRPR